MSQPLQVLRLYAYGKDDLSIASVNSGLPYVDDHTYSDRIVCAYWKDERYTVAENLKAAAQERLAELAVPSRSFECDVVDLAKTNPEKYSELDFVMFSVVSLIDQTRSGQKIDHIVVERWIYPNAPQNNKVILSTVAPRIQSQVTQIINSMKHSCGPLTYGKDLYRHQINTMQSRLRPCRKPRQGWQSG